MGETFTVYTVLNVNDINDGKIASISGSQTYTDSVVALTDAVDGEGAITDLAKAMKPDCEVKEIGIREGEKLHEVMITAEDAPRTYEYEKNYIIYPYYNWWSDSMVVPGGKKVEEGFEYSSGNVG